jgi:hypothetical protein
MTARITKRQVVEVIETRVFATRAGSEWWTTFLLAYGHTARIETVQLTLGGGVFNVAQDSREDAEWWMANAIDHGVPKSALRIRALGEPEQITVTIEPGDRSESLAEFASDFQMQRHLDGVPCSTCGGNRLRPGFVTVGRCHVPTPTTTEGAAS